MHECVCVRLCLCLWRMYVCCEWVCLCDWWMNKCVSVLCMSVCLWECVFCLLGCVCVCEWVVCLIVCVCGWCMSVRVCVRSQFHMHKLHVCVWMALLDTSLITAAYFLFMNKREISQGLPDIKTVCRLGSRKINAAAASDSTTVYLQEQREPWSKYVLSKNRTHRGSLKSDSS